MKIKIYATLIVATSTLVVFAQESSMSEAPALEKDSAVSASASIDVASAAIYRDGNKLSDSLVIQPGFTLGFETLCGQPIELGVWANYAAADGKKNGASQDHAFTEVDLSIGTSFDLGQDTTLGISLVSWQYPNMEGWNGEEVLALSLSKTFGFVEIGADFEKMITGDFEEHFDIYPYIAVSKTVSDISVSIKASTNYAMIPSWEGPDGWTAYSLTASVSAFNFTAYATYYGQMNDSLYTDEMHDDVNAVFGISYAVDL